MPRLGDFKNYPYPITALMDNRSAVDEVPAGYHRLVKNVLKLQSEKVLRLPGWKSFLLHDPSGNPNLKDNSDLRDQMLGKVLDYDAFTFTVPATLALSGHSFPYWFPPTPPTSFAYSLGAYPYQSNYSKIYAGTSGYSYGPGTNIYTQTPESSYEYCGAYLNYRAYCDTNFATAQGREAITLLREFQSGSGVRRLVAATQSRAYLRTANSHSWQIIADGLGGNNTCGCGTRRFRADQLGDYLLLTNNFDPPLMYAFDSTAAGCDLQAARPVQDLEDLRITKASVVVQFKGFLFLMNVEADGFRLPAKAFWSDYGLPTSWAPANDSLAGDSDIGDPGEGILNAAVLGDYLFVFKERSIWRVTLVDPAQGLFNIQQVYRGEKSLRYPNTLISVGTELYYLGHDNIYEFDLYRQTPQAVDWIQRPSGIIFDENLVFSYENLAGGIQKDDCDKAISGWDAVNNVLWFSWVSKRNSDGTSVAETTHETFSPRHSGTCNNRSLAINLLHKSNCYVDHGFTAFGLFREDSGENLRQWVLEAGACAESDWPPDLKEGKAYYIGTELAPDGNYKTDGFGIVQIRGLVRGSEYVLEAGENEIGFIMSGNIIYPGTFIADNIDFFAAGIQGQPITFSLRGLNGQETLANSIWNTTENPNLPSDANSFCSKLSNTTFDDLCGGCDTGTMFLMASAADYCIKQFDLESFFREHYSVSEGFQKLGYESVVESQALNMGADSEKYINRAMVEFVPPVQTPTPDLNMRLGFSSQPECEVWKLLSPQPLKCQTLASDTSAVRPYDKAYFNYLGRGRYLFFRFWVSGTTGATCFSRAELRIRRAEK